MVEAKDLNLKFDSNIREISEKGYNKSYQFEIEQTK